MYMYYSLSKLSWHDRKRGRKGIHLTENGSNKRHVILMGVNARAHYQEERGVISHKIIKRSDFPQNNIAIQEAKKQLYRLSHYISA